MVHREPIRSVDQLGGEIILRAPARRIVSLVPSQTSWLHALSLDEEVVGITKFCTEPLHWWTSKSRVGGTKDVHLDRVAALSPDLILANKEENQREQVEQLRSIAPVWVSDVTCLDTAMAMMKETAIMTGREALAEPLLNALAMDFEALKPMPQQKRTAYLIWNEPWLAAGGDTFIHDMMTRCGFINVFAQQARYPTTSPEALQAIDCEIVLLSSEPYPFKEADRQSLSVHMPGASIICVDALPFSWYGGPLLSAPRAFRELLGQIV
jgi:ABC-type Fe3+-hydroxamate transport system substrate-binding protein